MSTNDVPGASPDNVCADGNAAGLEPPRGTRVRSVAQGSSLGAPEIWRKTDDGQAKHHGFDTNGVAGLERMVSKRQDRPYRAGRSPDWIKAKNRKHPSIDRVKEAFS